MIGEFCSFFALPAVKVFVEIVLRKTAYNISIYVPTALRTSLQVI
jgi:hypothetical protein